MISQEEQQYTQRAESPFNLSKIQKNHNYLIEKIRKTATALEKSNRTITFTWVKAHSGTYGNE
jgi:RNase H.